MHGYVILSMSMDDTTCGDDGIFNACNFGLVGSVVHKTKKEAEEIREQTMDTDLEDFKELWTEEDGYTIEKEDGCCGERELNVYYEGDIINSTRYKIAEVDF